MLFFIFFCFVLLHEQENKYTYATNTKKKMAIVIIYYGTVPQNDATGFHKFSFLSSLLPQTSTWYKMLYIQQHLYTVLGYPDNDDKTNPWDAEGKLYTQLSIHIFLFSEKGNESSEDPYVSKGMLLGILKSGCCSGGGGSSSVLTEYTHMPVLKRTYSSSFLLPCLHRIANVACCFSVP